MALAKSIGMLGKSLCSAGSVVAIVMACSICRHNDFAKRCGRGPTGKASGLAWIHGTWCVYGHHPAVGMSRGNMGPPTQRAFSSSSSGGSQWLSRRQCPSSPVVTAETPQACALTGLPPLAAEGEAGSSGSQSPDLGDTWKYGCPKCPDWDSDVEAWTESEGTSSQCQHNVENLALNVMGQDQSGEKMSLFLEDWELARVALSCHIALDMLCQEMHEVAGLLLPQRPAVTVRKAFLSPWTRCDATVWGGGMW